MTDNYVTGTLSGLTRLTHTFSGFNLKETAGSTAVVRFRDSLPPLHHPAACADGAAGNVTTGLHMLALSGVTKWGETLLGPVLEYTSAGSKIGGITGIPTFDPNIYEEVVGRRIYATKAGAPATTVKPTTAQWFLMLADPASTLAAGMNTLELPQATITLASGTDFATSGKALVTTTNGIEAITYTGKSTNDLTGCTGGTGVMATGGAVTQPMIANNTATTYSYNLADASLANTRNPTKDTAGPPIITIDMVANETVGDSFVPVQLKNTGGLYVEVVSGAVSWTVRGT